VVRVAASFFPVATTDVITFSEKAVGTENPTFTPANYSAKTCPSSAPTVTTRGYFTGQRVSSNPATDCPGTDTPPFCIVGAPSPPLALAATSTSVAIRPDDFVPT
jgi:hypothetical protein